jgi:hypothetical protein
MHSQHFYGDCGQAFFIFMDDVIIIREKKDDQWSSVQLTTTRLTTGHLFFS